MQEKSKQLSCLFTVLMRTAVQPSFAMPGGGLAEKRIDGTAEHLAEHYGEAGAERLVDYCVYQVYRISGFGRDYLLKWKLSHSFGEKAVVRFVTCNQGQKYYEDRWLAEHGLTREKLLPYAEDRSVHPFDRFVYPEYEDGTKRRALSTVAGYYICGASTLLWTPFSAVCRRCTMSATCKVRTQRLYPELYRLRVEEFAKKRNG